MPRLATGRPAPLWAGRVMERVAAIVVGAGVIGLAIGRALALAGKPPLIVEGEAHFGSWTSSRNSEVIHAGLYYPAGSLKAQLCVDGRDRLYAFCVDRGVSHRRTGKLVFAHHEAQLPELEAIRKHAIGAGVENLALLDAGQVRALEPALPAAAALLSPSTGIVDSHALMQALLGETEARGGMLALKSRITRVTRRDGLWAIHVAGEDGPVVGAPVLINAAGLGAQRLAAVIEELDPVSIPPLHLARGVYFSYAGKVPFSRLIYPVPEAGGLGTHLTLDLAGQARFGPDVEWIDAVDYAVDPARHASFAAAARRIWPDLDPRKLQPGYAGIRPKVTGPGEPPGDFVVSGPEAHGCTGLINLFGIESPGLTAALAIAALVVERLG